MTITDIKTQAESIKTDQTNLDQRNKPVIVAIGGQVWSTFALQLQQLGCCFTLECFSSTEEALYYIERRWRIIDFIVLGDDLLDESVLKFLSSIRGDQNLKHLTVLEKSCGGEAFQNAIDTILGMQE